MNIGLRAPQRMSNSLYGGLLGYCLLLGLTGCADPGLKRHAVSGTVTLDGKPVEDCTIILTPKDRGLAAAAMIETGQFAMSEVDGPTVGEFTVRINPNEGEMEPVDSGDVPSGSRQRIPQPYQNGTALSATITGEPGQTLSFELSSKRKEGS